MLSIVAGVVLALMPSSMSAWPEDTLVVHEWGTFTSFSGPDGRPRVFQTSVGAALPEFVFSRALQAGNREEHDLDRLKFLHDTLVRMETPVMYFYTGVPRTVSVDVRMPDGSLTEFYPPVSRMEPDYQGMDHETPSGGRLVWSNISLIPGAQGISIVLPAVNNGDHYGAARQVDAAFVRVNAVSGIHHERFLFYRGIGNFNPPVTVRSEGNDHFVVTNHQAEAPPAVFVLDVNAGRLRYAEYGRCEKEMEVSLPGGEEGSVGTLGAAMEGALVNAGLYAKEAAAMVNTWKDSWFAEEGTRVMYIVPQAVTDRIVPLDVKPSPDAQVRVFVGRAEVMSREAQSRVESQLAALDDPKSGWRQPAISKLGRFATPVVKCIAESPKKPEAGKVARGMLGN